MLVSQIIKNKGDNVVTVGPTLPVAELARLLYANAIGAAVVTGAEGEVCGVVSERDVVHGVALRGEAVLGETVENLMSAPVITCRPEDDVAHVMKLVTRNRVRHVPVLDGGRLAGIVSIGDLVKHRLDEMENEVVALRDYVTGAVA